ncbi:hypothetical protein BC834DRAFT_373433 [Gloeopeniophorella convolvens]|nr:hypothetical protein BC834DRAFT_373433 [Gloeopeniophorella convolvens]
MGEAYGSAKVKGESDETNAHGNMALVTPYASATTETDTKPELNGVQDASHSRMLIEDEIMAMASSLASLKSRRNNFLTINRLSSEILLHLFHFHASIEPPGSPTNSLGWIAVTHVCRKWRRVALEDSALWGNIGFALGSTWVAEMFSRARMTPLDITISQSVARLDNLAVLPSHQSHVRSLGLEVPAESRQCVNQILSTAAPALENLSITSRNPDGEAAMDFDIAIDTTLFENQASRLRSVTLSRVAIPWESFPSCSLSHLEVQLPPQSKRHPLGTTLEGLFDVLSGNPNLESLLLDHCIPAASHQWLPQYRCIHLPGLRYLSLSGTSTDVFHVMSALVIPLSTKLRMHCISTITGDKDSCLIIPLIFARLHENDSEPLRSMSLKFPAVSGPSFPWFQLTAHSVHPTFEQSRQPELHLRIDSSGKGFAGELRSVFHLLFPLLPLEDLRSLDVDNGNMLDPQEWVSCLRRCHNVTTVRASGHLVGFLRALTHPSLAQPAANNAAVVATSALPSGNPVSAPLPRLFPRLTVLSITRVDLTIPLPAPQRDKTTAHVILDVVKELALPKFPRKTLEVTKCKFASHWVPLLSGLGSNFSTFRWDKESLASVSYDE